MSRIESAKDYSANGEWGTMNNVISEWVRIPVS